MKTAEVKARFLSEGLYISPDGIRAHFIDLLQWKQPAKRVRCVSTIGWNRERYALPDKVIGPGQTEEVFQRADSPAHLLRTRGTLEEWRDNVAILCVGNARLIFSVCAALTGPVLELYSEESYSLHIVGPSSIGKTTCLQVAGSVWGGGGRNGFVESWRSTSNALEATATIHNDGFLALDELSQANAHEIGQVVYMIGNGCGKARMTEHAKLTKRMEWRVVVLSSGERGLEEHLQSVGGRIHGGQQVRFIEIEADAGKGLGCFENIHGQPNADSFARHLGDVSKQYYGTLIREFLELLAFCRDDATERMQELHRQFLHEVVSLKNPPGEVSRVARKFARIAATGEYAIQRGILQWSPGDALAAAKVCFRSWEERRGNIKGSSDADRGINAVRAFLQTQADRFPYHSAPDGYISMKPSDSSNGSGLVRNRAGYRQRLQPPLTGMEFLIFPNVFADEICRDLDYKLTARALLERGFLIAQSVR